MALDKNKVIETLKETFPHGHPAYIPMCIDEMDLHSRKNHDYAHGGDPLGNFKRVSAILSNYPGLKLDNPAVIAIVYAMKQIDASLWMISQGYEGKVEGVQDRLQDIHNYIKLARILLMELEKEKPVKTDKAEPHPPPCTFDEKVICNQALERRDCSGCSHLPKTFLVRSANE